MLSLCHAERKAYAEQLLALNPDAIPRFLIYRDLLGWSVETDAYQEMYAAVAEHPHVKKIAESQNPCGFWEPFHGTTEAMIRRLLSYGLDRTHPTLAAAESYLVRLLAGDETTGQYERQDHPLWYTEMFEPLIAASMLSLLHPHHPVVEFHRKRWASFAEELFAGGDYCEAYDRDVKAAFFGYTVKRPIPPFNYYCLLLTAPVDGESYLSEKTDRALVDYCMTQLSALGYVYNEPPGIPIPIETNRRDSRDFWHWIRALSIIAPYRGFDAYAQRIGAFILSQRGEDGLWTFPRKFDFPLSDRYAGTSKTVDSSLFVLRLLCGLRGY